MLKIAYNIFLVERTTLKNRSDNPSPPPKAYSSDHKMADSKGLVLDRVFFECAFDGAVLDSTSDWKHVENRQSRRKN